MVLRRNGFTLVELMIVVAIIGILAAVAIPKFTQMIEKSREGSTKGSLATLRSAMLNYYADQQGNYPQTSLDTSTWGRNIASTIVTFPAFVPGYVDLVPSVKVTGFSTYNAPTDRTLGPGSGNSAAAVTTGNWDVPEFASTQGGFGWKYDNTAGFVWVNSEMIDMEGNSYTVYGYQ